MTRPVILTLADYYLPGYKAGGPVTTLANMVSRLGDDFQFKLITRDHDLGETTPYQDVAINQWNHVGDADVCYLSGGRRGRECLKDILIHYDYDLLYVNSFFSARFSIHPLLLRLRNRIPDRPVILAPRGEFAPGALMLKKKKKTAFRHVSKWMQLHREIHWQASSEFEKSDIHRVVGEDASVQIAPDLVAPFSPLDFCSGASVKRAGHLRLLFLSRICKTKNLLVSIKALNQVQGKVEFNIVGPIEDNGYWEQCRQAIEECPENITVRYVGVVPPKQVPDVMRGHDLFILPTLGENFGHVIVESLSQGCPVLISDRTKWKDLEAEEAGWEIPLEQPGAIGEILQNCIDMGHGQYLRLRKGARSYAENHAGRDECTLNENRNLFYSALKIEHSDKDYSGRAAA